MKKQVIAIIGALALSVLLGFVFSDDGEKKQRQIMFEVIDTSKSMFKQSVAYQSQEPTEIIKLYRDDQLIGVIHDQKKLDDLKNSYNQ